MYRFPYFKVIKGQVEVNLAMIVYLLAVAAGPIMCWSNQHWSFGKALLVFAIMAVAPAAYNAMISLFEMFGTKADGSIFMTPEK